MAYRFFRKKAQAERAAEKVRRAGFEVSIEKVLRGLAIVVISLTEDELDDILSKPLPRKRAHPRPPK